MTPPSIHTIRDALACIPPNLPRDEWARVAMALKSELGASEGFELFDAWSRGGDTYDEKATRSTWRSVKAGGAVGIGTLFHVAKAHGWKPDAVQTSAPRASADELKSQAEARRAASERERTEREQGQREAAAEAARLWHGASESGTAPYLQRKGVKAHGLRFLNDGSCLVPMRDAAGELWNVQTIRPAKPADGAPEKLFLKGGRKSGLCHLVGNPEGADWLLIAEGYATAASCHEATGRPVAVAFDCGNLAPVVRSLRGRWPDARVLVCGDDDAGTAERTGRNPGRDKATEAAKLGRGVAVFPELAEGVAGSDFNDAHASAGLAAVRDTIEAAIDAAALRAAQAPQAPQAPQAGEAGHGPGKARKTQPAGRQRAARGDGGDGANGGNGGSGGDAAGRFDAFRVDDDGLWFDPPDDGTGSAARPVKVCSPLRVAAIARDAHDAGAALMLEFDAFGKPRRWLMPLQTLAGDGTAYRAELLNQGFKAPTDAKRRGLLTQYLATRHPADLVRIVDRVGWHGRAYVLPRQTLGDDGGEVLMFQSEAQIEGGMSQRGSLDQWKDRIGRRCVGNSRLLFAASCAFAAPLLAWAGGTDGGGFHLVGDSSCGKTTALRVAASVWGGRDYLQRWRATDNGIEAMASQHSDALLCLDELAQLEARVAGEAAYMLANGQGKSRAGRTGIARPRLSWRLLFLSAGEIGLAEHMSEANKRTRAGQELRMIDLPADAGAGRGLFEELHQHDSAGTLAQFLSRAAETYFGTAGRDWLRHLVESTDGLSATLRRDMDAAEARFVPDAASGQVQRVGRRFALVAVAGELATDAGLTGWPNGAATAAAHRCFNTWIEARPAGIGMTEDEQMLRRARKWFQLHGRSARFPDFGRIDDDRAPQAIAQAGWRRELKHDSGKGLVEVQHEWLVHPEVFKDELCGNGNPRPLLQLLDSLGHLHKEKADGYTCGVPIDGAGRVRLYRVKATLLEAAGGE